MILPNCSPASARTTAAKHVSFQETIDRVDVDGTVERAVLKKAHSFSAISCLDLDFGLCRISDVSGSFDRSGDDEEEVVEQPERMIVSSYKKFAPRSQLQYIKRSSI